MFFGGRSSNNAIDNTRFYSALKLDRDASAADIKKAYRKLAVIHHPDKGGDPDTFKEITRAYEVLSDPEKRQVYDETGEEGLAEGSAAASSGNPMNLFDALFGGGVGRGVTRQQRPRTKDVVHDLSVTLEQLYTGEVKKMAVTRSVIDNEHGIQTCGECKGQGIKVRVFRRGPMIQQMQTECDVCRGRGKTFKMRSQRQVLEVHLQRGTPENHQVICRGMADEYPEADTGDIVFNLKQKEHPIFRRKGADLYVERTIALVEALCGFTLELQHLDGRKLLIKTNPGDIIRRSNSGFDPQMVSEMATEWEMHADLDCPSATSIAEAPSDDVNAIKTAYETQLKPRGVQAGAFVVGRGRAAFKAGTREEILASAQKSVGTTMYVAKDFASTSKLRLMKAVEGEGMPTFKEPFRHGNLFLVLNIEFPESLSEESQTIFRQHLPPPVNWTLLHEDDDDVQQHTVQDMDPVESYLANKPYMGETKGAYDEDEQRTQRSRL